MLIDVTFNSIFIKLFGYLVIFMYKTFVFKYIWLKFVFKHIYLGLKNIWCVSLKDVHKWFIMVSGSFP